MAALPMRISEADPLKLGGTNLNYNLILWRSAGLTNPLAWAPVATNAVTGITNNFLLSINGLVNDPNANATIISTR